MNITPTELKTRMDRGDSLRLIDVRENDEWAIAKLPQAELMPLSQFAELSAAGLSTEDDIVLYCHHGMRSGRAQAMLKAKGFSRTANLVGGIDGWATQIDPTMRRY